MTTESAWLPDVREDGLETYARYVTPSHKVFDFTFTWNWVGHSHPMMTYIGIFCDQGQEILATDLRSAPIGSLAKRSLWKAVDERGGLPELQTDTISAGQTSPLST